MPPYEHNQDELFKETKATISALVDGQHTFEEYLLYHKTLKLSNESQSILSSGTWDELSTLIQNRIEALEKEEKAFVHIPEKKWKNGPLYTLGYGDRSRAIAIVCDLHTIFSPTQSRKHM
ncbi:type VII secretion protein EssB/YukC [Peribacillus frigoritolerans]|nr:type VII secretion protein EssB/YukC [Peribacillus frigoritolerans]